MKKQKIFYPVNISRKKQIDEFIDNDHLVMTDYYDLMEKNLPDTKLKKELEILIKKDPDFYDPYSVLATVIIREGKYDKGMSLLKTAFERAIVRIVDKDGNFPKSLLWGWLGNRHIIRIIYTWAVELWKSNKLEEALDLFRRLLKSNPNDNIGARYSILAIRLNLTPGYDEQFESKRMPGYLDAVKISYWFEKNSKKFPDEFDWWWEEIKKEEEFVN